jgi:predicted acyltransferase
MRNPLTSSTDRLASLDALRGFDMFWIIGGGEIFHALAEYTNWAPLQYFAKVQLEHVSWQGFVFEDLIFPMFLFLSGVTLPLTLGRRLECGQPKSGLYVRVIRRAALLVLLGMVYNGVLGFRWGNEYFNFARFRFASVLGLIGLSYLFAALIVLNTRVRGQVIWMGGILLGYWAASQWIAVPPAGGGPAQAGVITPDGFFAGYIDRHLLPGRTYLATHDPEGLFLPVSGAALALMGALAGRWLMDARRSGLGKAGGLALGGVCSLALALLVQAAGFPIIKNCWSSSFVLFAGGWAMLLLSLFYLIVDVGQWRRWALPLTVIGVNPLVIYVGSGFIDFERITQRLFGGISGYLDTVTALTLHGQGIGGVLNAAGFVLVEVLFLYVLYRKKIFLRV